MVYHRELDKLGDPLEVILKLILACTYLVVIQTYEKQHKILPKRENRPYTENLGIKNDCFLLISF